LTPDQEALPATDSERPAAPVEPASDTRGRLGRLAFVAGLVGAALVHPIATLLARLDWRADLITHFREPALAVTLIAAVVLMRKHTRVALSLVCLAVVQAAPLVRYAGPNPIRPVENTPLRLRVLMANLYVDNTRYDALDRLIRRERPDVVGLVELTPEWLAGLAAIREEYPYRVEDPSGAAGLSLWFRERPHAIDPPAQPIPGSSPYLHAEFTFAGRPRHLWLVHPTMPIARKDRPELPALAATIGRARGSRIAIGDLNTTEGSPLFADFVRATGLRDTRLGFGRQPSWPTDWPYRIALEHAFVSDDLAVVNRRLGPTIGSDHFPLILDLAPAAGTLEVTNSTSQSGRSPGRGG
jgi:endonuclease/exonuclease/phosphatase (EEP) superfamily protein YafD